MRFRRKQDDVPAGADDVVPGADTEPAAPVRPDGPADADDLPDDGVQRVDLGSLLVEPHEGRELRMQVNESTGTVQAVLLADDDGAVEVRAFAAPRHGDLWNEIRSQIADDLRSQGGRAEEREGRWGTELVCEMQVRSDDGQEALQPSRIVGVNGPRWMLRATFLGRPAVEPEAAGWDDALTHIAVRRGNEAMPVGEALPITLPEQARRVGVPRPQEPDDG